MHAHEKEDDQCDEPKEHGHPQRGEHSKKGRLHPVSRLGTHNRDAEERNDEPDADSQQDCGVDEGATQQLRLRSSRVCRRGCFRDREFNSRRRYSGPGRNALELGGTESAPCHRIDLCCALEDPPGLGFGKTD